MSNVRLIDVEDLVDGDGIGLKDFENLELPESTSLVFPLVDHDARECRIVDAADLRERYIDNNIVKVMPPDLNMSPLAIDVEEIERHECEVHYSDNRILHVALERIELSPGARPRHFMQTGGLVFPTDEQGNIVLNETTVPFLAAVRSQFQADMERMSEQRIEIAELVNAFATIIGMNSNLPEAF